MPKIFLILLVFLAGCANNLFYQPDHRTYVTPDQLGLRYQDETFASHDGTVLNGWWIPAQPGPAKGTVIQLHGNAQNMSSHWGSVYWLPRQGYNVFVFDYRGYGKSAGVATLDGVLSDSVRAIEYIANRPGGEGKNLVVFGQSLGGANAIAALAQLPAGTARGLVVDSTFYSYSRIASDKVPGGGWLVSDAYSPHRYIAQLAPLPLLMFHGTADEVIDYSHGQDLFALAGQPKTFVPVTGGHHLDAFSNRFGSRYRQPLLDFLASVTTQ